MKIYTGIAGKGKDPEKCKLAKIRKYGLGVMISSSAGRKHNKDIKEFSCALDNGAFACYRKGYPFMEKVFLDTLDASYKAGIPLDFIVTPDIVCGGKQSLELSLEWASGRLKGCKNLALAVQDGMDAKMLKQYNLDDFSYIFVGGSEDWKWKTVADWVYFAASMGKKCHVGRSGQIQYLDKCKSLNVTSVDSTSFVVNDSWHIIHKLQNSKTLFEQAKEREADDGLATLKSLHKKLTQDK